MTPAQTAESNAVGYARVSSVGQADNGFSLEVQQEKIRLQCKLLDLPLRKTYVDQGSGGTLNRPALQQLLADAQRKALTHVVILKLDRITRSVQDLGKLIDLFKKHRIKLISIIEGINADTASGEMVMNILASVAQWERKSAGERTAQVLRFKKAHLDVYCRVPPFGFKADGKKLVPVPAEMAVVKQIRDRRTAGQSLREIAAILNSQGVLTRHGKAWAAESVRIVTANTVYDKVLSA